MFLALVLACAQRAPIAAPPPTAPVASSAPSEAPSPSADVAPAGDAHPILVPGWRAATVPTVGITAADASIGPADARFTIVSFADYFCPYCAAFWPRVRELVDRNPDVRLVLKNWPIDPACNPAVEQGGHRFACLAAEASECGTKMGMSVPMAELLYLYSDHVTPPEMPMFAEKLGMDQASFASCLADPAIEAAVASDIQAGTAVGVAGTPAVFVSGLDPAGWVDVVPRVDVIEAALVEARAGRPLPP